MDRPSDARSWQPLLCERPKDTVVPNAASTAFLSIASQTGLVSLDPDGLDDADGLLLSSSSSLGDSVGEEDGMGDPLRPPEPAGTSAATVPVPSTTWAHAAAVLAASNRASPARIRRALIYRSSPRLRVGIWWVTCRRLGQQCVAVCLVHHDHRPRRLLSLRGESGRGRQPSASRLRLRSVIKSDPRLSAVAS